DRQFVDGGFFVPEAKSGVAWVDEDTLWVGTDWGEGSLTESGYPRVVKEWKRGTPLSEARTLFEAEASDIGLWPVSFETAQGRISMLFRSLTFFTSEAYLGLDGRLVRLDLPVDSDFKAVFQDHAVFSLRSAWTTGGRTYAAGSLLAIDLDDLLAGRLSPSVVFAPSARVSLDSVATTRDRLLITTLDNVRSRLYRVKFADDEWTKEEMALPGLGAASIADASDDSDIFFYTYEDFLTPDSLYLSLDGKDEKLKSLPAFFDFDGIEVSQIDATSRDGTNIPYFFVAPKGFEADGTAPTLLYAYGGFEVSQRPSYSATVGTAWLERGGAFVVANIRGGGEFGPEWHQAAVQENHHRNFEDFIAVAEDLVATNRTSPNHLGIMGGSQGGLLVGGTFTLRPELFNAAVSQVPLLDMKRYHKLLAGASWISEYGDPDNPEHWAYIQTWSPYHLLREDATYPEVFFWTTTRDDRVHPGHARKMVAKLIDMKHPVLYFENTEGGHGSGSTNAQRAQIDALQFAYLWKKLGG
ncbi:MAG: prolyl oligopeptidase family serine peptidase, partial [Pseudomonadota bacterium]